MKNITHTISYAILSAMFLMLVFGVIALQPAQANADYGYGYYGGSGYRDLGYYGTPTYDYNSYHYPPQNNYEALRVSCYPMPLSAHTGDSVTWVASAYGGNNSYNYTWSGTDGLSGYGSSVIKTYYSSGSKSASVTVMSGGQTVSKNCDGSVTIYGDAYYNYNYYNQQPYYYPTYNYSPLYVTCSANTAYGSVSNGGVTWNAYASGGNGSYSYSWTGTDNLYGSNQSVYYTYASPGIKTANVTVYSNGQSITQNCGTANVGGYYNYNYNYNNYNPVIIPTSSNNSLDVACYVDPTSARVNQPVTWRAEATGGIAPYTYNWTGSDGLSGSDNTSLKYYSSTGDKSAVVTVKSADGRSATSACSTSVTIRSASSVAAPAQTVQPAQQVQPNTNNNGLSAAALFSLKNVPWGWVAILVILVLFATVVYLLFNRQKI